MNDTLNFSRSSIKELCLRTEGNKRHINVKGKNEYILSIQRLEKGKKNGRNSMIFFLSKTNVGLKTNSPGRTWLNFSVLCWGISYSCNKFTILSLGSCLSSATALKNRIKVNTDDLTSGSFTIWWNDWLPKNKKTRCYTTEVHNLYLNI